MPSHDKKTKRTSEEIFNAYWDTKESDQKTDTLTIPQPSAGMPSEGKRTSEEIFNAY